MILNQTFLDAYNTHGQTAKDKSEMTGQWGPVSGQEDGRHVFLIGRLDLLAPKSVIKLP